MTYIEIVGQDEEFTRQQRWSHILTLITGLGLFLFGLNLRSGALNATTTYNDIQAGISATYPQNWLIDFNGDYVFRVHDVTGIGFGATIQIALKPIGQNTTERNILDTLNITRPQTVTGYVPLLVEPFTLDESEAVALNYTFVDKDYNPFLESIPTVVRGQDIIILRGGQAIIITFLAASQQFDDDMAIFERFLDSLEL